MRLIMMPALFVALMSAGPALAGSQSSNSSSNCSDGYCTRVESLVIENGRFLRGYHRREAWEEGRGRWRESRRYEERDRRDRGERRYRGDRREGDDDDD